MAGVPINDGNEVRAPRYLDLRYGKIVGSRSVPYDTRDEALAAILSTRRCEGLQVYIKNGAVIEDWQFIGGIADINLVRKSAISEVFEIEVFVGTAEAIAAGVIAGATTIIAEEFVSKKLNMIRGSLPLPGILPSDGSAWYDKPLPSDTCTFSSALNNGEYLKITTYTPAS